MAEPIKIGNGILCQIKHPYYYYEKYSRALDYEKATRELLDYYE